MKMMIPLLILAAGTLASAEEKLTFKTREGLEFKDVILSKVEPSGITIETPDGLERIPFTKLPEELQRRFHYDPKKAAQHETAVSRANTDRIQRNADIAAAEEKQKASEAAAMADYAQQKIVDAELPKIQELGIFRPTYFGEKETSGYFARIVKVQTGTEVRGLNTVPVEGYQRSEEIRIVVEGKMNAEIGRGDQVPTILYRIGFTKDASRDPLYTSHKSRAAAYILERASTAR